MPTPNVGVIDGGDILVYVKIALVWTPVAHCTECSIQNSTEVRSRSTKDTGRFDEKRAGKQGTTISVSALAAYDTYNYFDLRALQLAGTPVVLKYSGRPVADVTDGKAVIAEEIGDKYETGTFIITSVERNDAKDADSTMTASFENSGAVSIETVPVV